MEDILKKMGWKELHPKTIERLEFFVTLFREHYSVDEISDAELEITVCYAFGVFGQEFVYDIYMTLTSDFNDNKKPIDTFSTFAEELGKVNENTKKPIHMIRLFIEFLFSLVIKR